MKSSEYKPKVFINYIYFIFFSSVLYTNQVYNINKLEKIRLEPNRLVQLDMNQLTKLN